MIERKNLIKRIMPIAVPIMMQYFVLSVINATNTIMMGMIDEISLSAISIGNQIMNIYSAFMIGLCAGATALFAQFWGVEDVNSEKRIEAIALQISMSCSLLVFLGTLFIPDIICSWYTNDAAVMVQATEYLRITSIAYLAMGFSQVYLTLLKTTGNVKRSSVISVETGVAGIIISAILVFGYLGSPRLGLIGAALSVSISRCFELIITIIDCRKTRKFWLRPKDLINRNKSLRGRFYRAALPALVNTMGYNIALSVTVGILGHIGTTALAAFAVANVIFMLFTPIATGYGSAMGIVVGNELGRNELELAKKLGDVGMRLGWIVGICSTVLMSACCLFTPILGRKLTDDGKSYLMWMIVVLAIKLIGAIINTALANGIFAAGGDTIFMCKTDIINMWLIIIPLGLLATNVLKLPVMVIFIILNIDEFTKMPFEYIHYKKYKWVRNLTYKA